MRNVAVLVFSVFLLALPTITAYGSTDIPSVSAQASVLLCVNNGKVLYSSNKDTRLPIASTTKLMTSLITLEESQKDNKVVTFKRNMIEEGSSMYLKIGEQVTLQDLCTGMLLPSGNDAATAAAISVSGSKEDFSKLMNKRAKKLGMNNTSFVTPSGLDDPDHYSTAYDMALLMKECLKNKKFCAISRCKGRAVKFVKPSKKVVTYINHNRLLSTYDYCISGKTGYTESAGRCLVTAARKNGVTLVAVTLNDKNDWKDHTSLYEYGFQKVKSQQFSKKELKQNVVGGIKQTAKLEIQGKTFISEKCLIKERILIPPFAYTPIKKGARAGVVEYIEDGKVIDRQILRYKENIDYNGSEESFWEWLKGIF